MPLAVFYGGNNQAPMSPPEIVRAKTVCALCPVRRRCLQDGMDEEWGIWGGLTRPERVRAQQILGTWIEDDEGLTIIPADTAAVLRSYDRGDLIELVTLR